MEITKSELRKISRKFRSLGSRVMYAYFNEVNSQIKMFVHYIDTTPIIKEYITSVYIAIPDLEEELKQASGGYGRYIIPTGNTPDEELNKIYQILKYVSENQDYDVGMIGWGYTSSTKFQDMVEEFGNRVVQPFIANVDEYLMDISTDMGYDEENSFMIAINGGTAQVNISKDNSTLTATQNNSVITHELETLINEIRVNLKRIEVPEEMQGMLLANLNLVEDEIKKSSPQKTVLKTAITTLSTIVKGIPTAVSSAEAIQKLIEMVKPLFQ